MLLSAVVVIVGSAGERWDRERANGDGARRTEATKAPLRFAAQHNTAWELGARDD